MTGCWASSALLSISLACATSTLGSTLCLARCVSPSPGPRTRPLRAQLATVGRTTRFTSSSEAVAGLLGQGETAHVRLDGTFQAGCSTRRASLARGRGPLHPPHDVALLCGWPCESLAPRVRPPAHRIHPDPLSEQKHATRHNLLSSRPAPCGPTCRRVLLITGASAALRS
jgi:hypothetical protein